ncbi:MAG TPA: ATP-binding cassette domain-containing protein [Blastocatellia bacterium]|nr:ATP-binding cassette domain-containing protein [Blastocatellia bacterium]
MPPAIEFDRVEFRYPGGPLLLDGLSLAIEAGETLALVGRSGMGKSTILKLINHLLLPTSGVVRVEGRDTTEWDAIRLRRHIGYVLQEVGLFPHLTIERNVGIVPRLEGWSEDRIRARVDELLRLTGLDPETYRDRYPRELSGGQRQRVGVARALALDPTILLMDEPFGALDPLTRVEIHREFRRIQETIRKTVVIVTHDMGEAFTLSTRMGVLAAGKLAAITTPAEIVRSTSPEVRMLLDTVTSIPRPQ